jgi:hypothetical protein
MYGKCCILFETYSILIDIVRNKQAGEYLGISRATLSRLKKDGVLRILYISKAKTTYLSFQQISDPKLITHGSVIFISPLKSIGCNDLMTDFGKPRSNDFNRLEGKWANRR